MKLAFVAIVTLASVAVVASDATTATATTTTPCSISTRRHGGYRRLWPFWIPRSHRRELSPIPTKVTRKRDGASSESAPGPPTETVDLFTPPAVPSLSDPFEVLDPFPADILTSLSSASEPSDASSSITTSSTSVSATGTSGPSPTGLPNEASSSVWEDAANHGCRLVDAMRVSDHDAGQLYSPVKDSVQSTLMSYEEDFQGWGWNANEISGGNFSDFEGGRTKPDPGWGIGNALRELGLSDKTKAHGGKNTIIDAVHGKNPFTQGYTKNGKKYPATGAEFKIGVNVDEGVLMAIDRISPASAAKERNPEISDDQLPDVHTFSDVGYLTYKKALGMDPTSLRYMMSLMITNEKTASIIAKVLHNKSKTLGPWPGETFFWGSKEFKALLGSPNGMGFGYLLVQHKSQLGKMFIKQVQVFHGDTWHHLPNMVFTLEEQNGQEPPPKTSGLPPQMEEFVTTAVGKELKSRAAAPAQTEIHIQGVKNFVRTHIMHAEL